MLSPEQLTEIQKRLDRGYPISNPTASDVMDLCDDLRSALAHIAALEGELKAAQAWQMDIEEREAACCPEDVGFDEYIRHLQKKLEATQGALDCANADDIQIGINDFRAKLVEAVRECYRPWADYGSDEDALAALIDLIESFEATNE